MNKDKNINSMKNKTSTAKVSYVMSIYSNARTLFIILVSILLILYAISLNSGAQQAFGWFLMVIIPILMMAQIYSAICSAISIVLYISTYGQIKGIFRKIMNIISILNIIFTISVIFYLIFFINKYRK